MRLLLKIFSGRYLLTVASSIVFGYCSIKGILKPEIVATILTMVFTLYFTRTDRLNGGEKK